eukprot:4953355-Prymnesium_polylepis.2
MCDDFEFARARRWPLHGPRRVARACARTCGMRGPMHARRGDADDVGHTQTRRIFFISFLSRHVTRIARDRESIVTAVPVYCSCSSARTAVRRTRSRALPVPTLGAYAASNGLPTLVAARCDVS